MQGTVFAKAGDGGLPWRREVTRKGVPADGVGKLLKKAVTGEGMH